MRILLVDTGQEPDIDTNLPRFVDEQRGRLPHLGLMYVATAVKQSGYDVAILEDMNVMETTLKEYNPDIVGVTATTFTLLRALEIIKFVKEHSTALTVVGGVHASIYPEETSLLPNVDYVVSGEGDIAFPELIVKIINGNAPKVTRVDGYIDKLDLLPIPDRSLTDIKGYSSVFGSNGCVTTMMSSRGCPFGCKFCHRPHMGRRFRARTVDSVLKEFRQIKQAGIGEVMVYDDTFAVNRDRVVRICNGLIDEQLNMAWDMRTRVDLVDIELLRLLKKAGCKRIHYGVEASSEKTLKILGKGITLKQAEDAVEATKKAGIETLLYFILGNPEETIEDMLQTIRYSIKLNPDYCHYALLTPYPVTEIYDRWRMETGNPDHWEYFANYPSPFKPPYYMEHIYGRETLEEVLADAYKAFYTRPSYLFKRVARIRSIDDAIKGLKVFAKINK